MTPDEKRRKGGQGKVNIWRLFFFPPLLEEVGGESAEGRSYLQQFLFSQTPKTPKVSLGSGGMGVGPSWVGGGVTQIGNAAL